MFSTPTLEINLAAITANWQRLRTRFTGDETGAVVKANAYGLGAIEVATALEAAGCHTFFVATLDEAIALRTALPDVRILVLHGVQKGEEFAFRQHQIIPVLNSPEQLMRWRPVATEYRHAVSALHLDTAMARLGLTEREWRDISDGALLKECRVSLIMSHLAYSSDPKDPRNAQQLQHFKDRMHNVHGIPASLSNSGGILLAPEYHYQLARPGCALYGIHPSGHSNKTTQRQTEQARPRRHEVSEGESHSEREQRNALPESVANNEILLQQVAQWRAPILQTRILDEAQEVGYGGLVRCKKNTHIATVATGYADGYVRSVTSQGAYGLLQGKRVPLLGRVTMDMLAFDITGIDAHEGDTITLLGTDGAETITIDQLAAWAGTIGYECLTRIGDRVKREYIA